MFNIKFLINDFIIEMMIKLLKKIFEKYKDFVNVFDKINANKLLKQDSQNHAINTKNKMFSFELMYNLLMIKLELFKKYLNEFFNKKIYCILFVVRRRIDFICRKIEK
jgi:hypothetical protein